MNEKELDKLLFWFVQAAMWGRFSGSTESFIDKDLEALEGGDGVLDRLLEQLRLWHGGLRAETGHFSGWSLGARFYPVLYMPTRMGKARDWGTGLPLKANLLGKMSRLEVHHIFSKVQLYKAKALNFRKLEVNALGNFCFLMKDTNLKISDSLPEDYFPEARKTLLAAELNRQMENLLHGDKRWLVENTVTRAEPMTVVGGISSEEEEQELETLNDWVAGEGLPRGILAFDHADLDSGEQIAVFDLAWPNGLQEELSQPVVVLLNEGASTIALASQAGYRCFTDTGAFRRYVQAEVLGENLDR